MTEQKSGLLVVKEKYQYEPTKEDCYIPEKSPCTVEDLMVV